MTYAPDATALVGNTPLVRINRVTDGAPATVLAKVEAFEPAASVKDRIALSIVRAAEASGDLKPGGTIVEATSGNTGVGLAMVGAALGYKVIITMPETMSKERRAIMRAFGRGAGADHRWRRGRGGQARRGDPGRHPPTRSSPPSSATRPTPRSTERPQPGRSWSRPGVTSTSSWPGLAPGAL